MTEPAPKFDARLEEGVRYFEQMLEENLEQCERCMAFLADRFSTPPVPVAAFGRWASPLLLCH